MQVRLTPMSFDASASSDPDGDALSYTWDFGDGERGGSASLAHAFSAAGSFTVKLTVADGRGGVSTAQHTVTVSALTHGAAVIVNGIVEDVAGPLSGVSIQDVGGASVTSDAAGRVAISLSVGIAHTLKLSKAGYADQFQPMSLDAAATNGLFRVVMLAREAAQNLDAAAGGNLSGKHGAKITLPAGSLQDASGVAVTGAIQITQTPVDISSNMKGTFPGTFTGVTADGAQTPIASYGSTEFALSKNGQKLQLAPGKTAAIELPIYASQHLTGTNIAAGDQIPLWSLSEKTGLWVQEGHGTVVASSASPSGFALQAQVSHFSWWNGDAPERGGYKPKPRCFLNPGPEFLPIPIPCTIGPPLPGEFSVVTPVKQGLTTFFGVPYYALRIDIPINGGVQVPIPQDIDFPLNACALSNNLFFCGSLTVHGANGVSDEPHILLNPLAPAGTCGSPTAITLPLQQQAFAINSADQASCLHFSAVAGQFLSLSIAQVAGSSLSGSLQLTGPAGQILGTASFGTGRAGSMTIVTPTAGDYGIKIGADSGVPGGFVLSASLETPQQIAVPSTAVYQVDAVTGVKRFVLDAAAGDVVAVSARASGPNGGSPGTITSAVDGTTSSFLGSGYGPVTFRPTISGSYGFTVQTNRSNGRDVLVTVSKAQSLDVGATGTGAVPKDGTVTSFAFQGTAGTLIAAAISTESLNQNNANLCPRPMRVFDPAGVELTPPSSGSVLQLGPVALTSSGKYRLDLFAPIGFGCDAESVRVTTVDQPLAATVGAASISASGSLTAIGDQRYYTVSLNQGDLVRLAMHTPDTLGATAELLPPSTAAFFKPLSVLSGASESSSFDVNTHFNDGGSDSFLVPATGVYVVHVSHQGYRQGNAAGSFTWTLLRPPTQNLPVDALVNASTMVTFQIDRYGFTLASAGARSFFTGLSPVNVEIFSELRDSSGTVLRRTLNTSTSSFTLQLPAGSYTYDVFGDLSSAGTTNTSYQVVSAALAPPAAIAVGDTKSAAIDVVSQRDYYQFTAVQGQAYTLGSTSGTVSGVVMAYPIVASGDFTDETRFFSIGATSAIGTPFTFTAQVPGTFIVEVRSGFSNVSSSDTSTGAYTLSLH